MARRGGFIAMARKFNPARATLAQSECMALGQLALHNHGQERWFKGAIDEVALYDRALIPKEVLSHYQR